MRILIVATFLIATSQAVNPVTVESVVRGAADTFAAEYFDAQIGASVSAEIKRRLESGQYAVLQTNQELADRLTNDLLQLTGDKHVALRLRRAAGGGNASAQRRDVPTAAGFRRTEILPGNIGLLDIAFFLRPVEHRDALDAAMKQLQGADALILDMRENGGGSPATVALLVSYLIDEPGKPLFEIRPRAGERDVYVSCRRAETRSVRYMC